MVADTAGLSKGLNKGRSEVKGFTSAVNTSGAALTALAVKAAAILGPFIALNAVIGKVGESMHNIASTSRLANRLNADTEALSGLQFAASQSGLEVDAFGDALSDLVEKLGDARMGGGDAEEALTALGLSFNDLSKMDPTQAFSLIAEEISKLDNQADKLTLADKLFGGEGQRLVPLLDQGAAGIAELTARAKELGVSFDAVDAAKIVQANKSIKELGAVFDGIYNQLAIQVAPIITATIKSIMDLGKQGYDAGAMIASGMDVAVYAFGWVVDVIDGLYLTFKAVQSGMTWGLSALAKFVWAQIAPWEAIIETLTGVKLGIADLADEVANGLADLGADQWKDFEKRLNSPLPSKGVDDFYANLKRHQQEAQKTLSKAGTKTMVTPADTENKKAVDDYIDSLNKQIFTIKQGSDALKIEELRQLGVNDSILRNVEALQLQSKALEESKQKKLDLENYAKSVKESLITPIQRYQMELDKLRNAKKAGLITQQQFNLASLNALPEQVKAIMEKSKSEFESFKFEYMKLRDLLAQKLITPDQFKMELFDKLPDQIKNLIAKTKSPLEQFQEQLKNLEKYKPILNKEQFQTAVAKLQKQFGLDFNVKLSGAAKLGSNEARNTVLRNRFGSRDPMKDLTKTSKEQLAESKKQTQELKKVNTTPNKIYVFA